MDKVIRMLRNVAILAILAVGVGIAAQRAEATVRCCCPCSGHICCRTLPGNVCPLCS